MTSQDKTTEPRLRFRINMLLAERDMTLKQLYDRVKGLGSSISSSHFYRQMKPYHSPIRLDLLTLVVRALKADPSELFELVEVEIDENTIQRKDVEGSEPKAKPADEQAESEKAMAARAATKKKRDMAMLGGKISVLPSSKDK